MKKFFLTISLIFGIICSLAAQQPKYFFYFIGDGMGVNEICFTQYYKAAVAGQHGTLPLCFSTFPVTSFATTWCLDREVTDSAASGSALATGQKINYKALSQDPSGAPIQSVAEMAKAAGRKVAILTTVSVNNATPAAFYAHQNLRSNYDAIVYDLVKSNFDFFAGSRIDRGKKEALIENLDPKKEITKAGYKFAGSREEFLSIAKKAEKVIMIPDDKHTVTLAIDRGISSKKPLTLCDMLSSGVEFLMKDGCPQGFFLMAEGGKIDGGAHGNDAAATIQEILDFEQAVQYAIDFYNQHPTETAILVTSDHDTGASTVKPKSKEALLALSYQKACGDKITSILTSQLKERKGQMSWEEIKIFLAEHIGLWTGFPVKEKDEKALRDIYDRTIARATVGGVFDEWGYNETAEIIVKALEISNDYAGITWNTTGHSGSFVPVYYMGPRQEMFSGMNDNAGIGGKVISLLFQ